MTGTPPPPPPPSGEPLAPAHQWEPPSGEPNKRPKKPFRPQLIIGIVALVIFRGGREVLGRWFGWQGIVGGAIVAVLLIVGWRLIVYRRAKRHGGSEYTPEAIAKQFRGAGVAPAAFAEDGTLLGASLFAVNQKSKLIEVVGEYEIIGSDGTRLGAVRQIGQGNFKKFIRFIGAFDQFFTHHFDIVDARDVVLLRVTRPAKLFKSRVEVFDGSDHFLGRIVQRNVFGKIDFNLYTADGRQIGALKAENWRAWDFRIEQPGGAEIARITKTWEGTARTVFTSADTYVVRIHQQLDDPLRSLVFVAALTVDLALKQDARGLGG